MFKCLFRKEKNNLKIPNHIAFICDGNRRWAKSKKLAPFMGHKAGISNFSKLIDFYIEKGVSTITFFIFSTENWNRSEEEVNFLMNLFYEEIEKNFHNGIEKNIRYKIIGTRKGLPLKLAKLCDKLEKETNLNTSGTVVFALNYGGQDEIINAVNSAIKNGKSVSKESFEVYLNTGDLLPVDLMVRTSNEFRISNFLLWKLAYAELLFIKEHWPTFIKDEKLWLEILKEYTKRDRRFGGGIKKDYLGSK